MKNFLYSATIFLIKAFWWAFFWVMLAMGIGGIAMAFDYGRTFSIYAFGAWFLALVMWAAYKSRKIIKSLSN